MSHVCNGSYCPLSLFLLDTDSFLSLVGHVKSAVMARNLSATTAVGEVEAVIVIMTLFLDVEGQIRLQVRVNAWLGS